MALAFGSSMFRSYATYDWPERYVLFCCVNFSSSYSFHLILAELCGEFKTMMSYCPFKYYAKRCCLFPDDQDISRWSIYYLACNDAVN